MELREKIFNEIKRLNLGKRHIWVFQQYIVFYNKLNPLEKEDFYKELQKLVDEGLFEVKQDSLVEHLVLTEKGCNIIYSDVDIL